jgi:hypothetical protein
MTTLTDFIFKLVTGGPRLPHDLRMKLLNVLLYNNLNLLLVSDINNVLNCLVSVEPRQIFLKLCINHVSSQSEIPQKPKKVIQGSYNPKKLVWSRLFEIKTNDTRAVIWKCGDKNVHGIVDKSGLCTIKQNNQTFQVKRPLTVDDKLEMSLAAIIRYDKNIIYDYWPQPSPIFKLDKYLNSEGLFVNGIGSINPYRAQHILSDSDIQTFARGRHRFHLEDAWILIRCAYALEFVPIRYNFSIESEFEINSFFYRCGEIYLFYITEVSSFYVPPVVYGLIDEASKTWLIVGCKNGHPFFFTNKIECINSDIESPFCPKLTRKNPKKILNSMVSTFSKIIDYEGSSY